MSLLNSPENKQRIVGIIVLIAIIALLVPFLFTSGIRKKIYTSDEIPIGAQKRQLITEQIQNIDNANTTAISADTTTSAVNTTQQTSAMPPSDQPEQPDAQLSTSSDNNQIAEPIKQDALQSIENNKSEQANNYTLPQSQEGNQDELQDSIPQSTSDQVVTSEPLASVAATQVIKISKNKAAATKTLKNKNIKKSTSVKKIKNKNINSKKESWSVQVGSFSDQDRIKKLIDQLHVNGFNVYMQKITTENGLLTRVFIGREQSKEKADNVADRLEAATQIKGRVVRN